MFLLVCIGLSIALPLYTIPPGQGAWASGLDDYQYRRSHLINNATGAGSNYVIDTTVYYDTPYAVPSSPNASDLFETNDEWTMLQHVHPQAIYYVGTWAQTYFVWLDTDSPSWDVKIKAYRHNTTAWLPEEWITLDIGNDAHYAPSIGVLPNSSLIVFYGSHGSNQKYKISAAAENIYSFNGSELTWTGAYTYPNPTSYSDEIVVFVRETLVAGAHQQWVRKNSTDGITWSTETEIVNFGYGYAPYFMFRKAVDSDTLLVAGMLHNYSIPDSQNLYFAYSMDRGYTWYTAGGVSIALPLGTPETDCKIHNTAVSITDAFTCLDPNGRPMVMAFDRDRNFYNITHFSNQLGSSGAWSTQASVLNPLTNSSYELGRFARIFVDMSGYVAFWSGDASDLHVKKFRKRANSNRYFDVSYTDPDVTLYNYTTLRTRYHYVEYGDLSENIRFEMFGCEWVGATTYNVIARSDKSYGSHVGCYEHCQEDFGDIRFAYANGTELNYYLHYKSDGDKAKFWVQIGEDLSSSDLTIYMYYGNLTVASGVTTSNGPHVFPLFDAFEDGSINATLWSETGLDDGDQFYESNHVLWMDDTDTDTSTLNTWAGLEGNYSVPTDSYEVYLENMTWDDGDSNTPAAQWGLVLGNASRNRALELVMQDHWSTSTGRWISYVDNNYVAGSSGDLAHADVANLTIRVDQANYTKIYYNATLWHNATKSYVADTLLLVYNGHTNTNYANLTEQLVWIRPYVDPEPVQGKWGLEELQPLSHMVDVDQTVTSTWSVLSQLSKQAALTITSAFTWTIDSVLSGVTTLSAALSQTLNFSWTVALANGTWTAHIADLTKAFSIALDVWTAYVEGLPVIPIGEYTTEAWYFRSDNWTVKDTLGYKLDQTQSSSSIYVEDTASSLREYQVGVRIYRISSVTELSYGAPVGIVSRSTTTNGTMLNATWTHARIVNLQFQDAIRVDLYTKVGNASWTKKAVFISRYLMTDEMLNSEWFIRYYISVTESGGTYYYRFHYGNSSTNSRINNIQFRVLNAWDTGFYFLHEHDLIQFLLNPFTFNLGDLFYGLVVLFIGVTSYNRYRNIYAPLILILLFAGAGGALTLLIPNVALNIAFLIFGFAITALIFKLLF